jgi:hypothetical protein
MPLNVDLSQIVFRKSIIEERFPGGVEEFKTTFKFSITPRNAEDNELISFVSMNAEDVNFAAAACFDWQKDDEGFLVDPSMFFFKVMELVGDGEDLRISSKEFVIINRYGGKMWPCDWIEPMVDDYPVFFWDITASESAKQEAIKRSKCFISEIESTYGSWAAWGAPIV